MELEKIKKEAFDVFSEYLEKSGLKKGQTLVVGFSSSEVSGGVIGKNSSEDVAVAVYDAIKPLLSGKGIFLAAQCCEHLNRAIVIEREAVKNEEIVSVIPQVKAGGSFATTCYKNFSDPVVVENIKADGGIDVGLTLIGMHLRHVAVPLRLEHSKIGEATVVFATTRPKFIGGSRATYENS